MKSVDFAGAGAEELTDWSPVMREICFKKGYFNSKGSAEQGKAAKSNGTFLENHAKYRQLKAYRPPVCNPRYRVAL